MVSGQGEDQHPAGGGWLVGGSRGGRGDDAVLGGEGDDAVLGGEGDDAVGEGDYAVRGTW